MSLKHIDFDAAFRRMADRQIEEAINEGKFDNLPGAGKPLELEPMPADEAARMNWWMIRLLRRNDVVPQEVTWRKRADALRAQLAAAPDEAEVRRLVGQINHLIHKLNTLGTNLLRDGLSPVDEAEALAAYRART